MNGLKDRRLALGLSQPDVVRLLRSRCPVMDVSLYSKMENGHCLPNKETLAVLESALQTTRTELFDEDALSAMMDTGYAEDADCEDYDALNRLQNAIPHGRRNAITREKLAKKMGVNDRAMRRIIESARRAGLVILNDQSGKGYYQSTDPLEMRVQYHQDMNRAASILKRIKPLRDALRAAGQHI